MIDAGESEAGTPQAGMLSLGRRGGEGGLAGPGRKEAENKGGGAGGQDLPDSVSHQP